jgi:hypothetical protein
MHNAFINIWTYLITRNSCRPMLHEYVGAERHLALDNLEVTKQSRTMSETHCVERSNRTIKEKAADETMNGQTYLSEDELHKKAEKTWGALQVFFWGIFLIAFMVMGSLCYGIYRVFKLPGLVIAAVLLVVGLFLLCRQFLKH